MCFSPTGSFVLSGVLASVGAVAVTQNSSRHHRMFTAIPFLFAGQQAAEGVVWLAAKGGADSSLTRLAVAVFLGFALVVWPVWVPLSLRRIERNAGRRRTLTVLSLVGAGVSVSAAFLLALWEPVAAIAGHSIRYSYGYAGNGGMARELFLLVAYLTPTIIPFFVSTTSTTKAIGATLLVSLFAAGLIERDALTSVWCFFAAILSGLILVAVRREERLTVRVRRIDYSDRNWP
ncbi:MAG TPA: DUF6629 family protein [Gemmatimonadaceae bacterium]|nr:DUF6629 family protein [Gemmatimonadaceae bacterium]